MTRVRSFGPGVRLVSATIVIGAAAGAVIGGLGGRLAMRVLFLTSGPAVKGLVSDDDFRIGRFTLAGTANLVVVTLFIGVAAALLYLVAHPFLGPLGRRSAPVMAGFYGVIGAAMMVHQGGIDFTVLHPAALAIILFAAISAAFGGVVARLVDRAARDDAWPQRMSWWLMGPPLLVLAIPPFLALAAAGAVLHRLAGVSGDGRVLWRVLNVGAMASMTAMFVFGAIDLARDAAALT